jgi:predicted transglutaminase-like cysteine proteinase
MQITGQSIGNVAVTAFVLAMATFILVMPTRAATLDFADPAFTEVGGATSIPIGASEFCRTHRADCSPGRKPQAVTDLTQALWNQLVGVNDEVNADVIQVTDEDQYQVAEFWTYPNGYGDCEDIALEKRRELISDGWNPSTLLMTVVRQADGEGHAVLTVRTDRGDLILDNQDDRVLVWSATPYQYLKRQSQLNSSQWVSLLDDHEVTVASGPAGITAGQ